MKHIIYVFISVFLASGAARADALKEALDKTFNDLAVREKMETLGRPISPNDQKVFGEKVRVRAYEKGFIVAYLEDSGAVNVKKMSLTLPSPKTSPIGDIHKVYNKQGGKKRFGVPYEGEISIFDDTFRIHIFQKSVIFWQRKGRVVQYALFPKKFASR